MREGALFESGGLLILSETHYRYQKIAIQLF